MNYHDKRFKVISNSDNGEVNEEMIFHYRQEGDVLSCSYTGDKIVQGHLLGKVDEDGIICMSYLQINSAGEIMTGKCTSTPEILDSGKIRLHEKWTWTSGDLSSGTSTLEEI